MKIVKTAKYRKYKNCLTDIWPNSHYYPQKRGKALCFNCGYKEKRKNKSFIKWLLGKLK